MTNGIQKHYQFRPAKEWNLKIKKHNSGCWEIEHNSHISLDVLNKCYFSFFSPTYMILRNAESQQQRFSYSRFWLLEDSKTANNEGKLLFWDQI